MTQIPLPIDEVLDDISRTLRAGNRLVLAAPPGAGKTTRVPLHLLSEDWVTGRILLLEPRRIAARMAAERMAAILGEKVGDTIGLSTRIDRRISDRTRIEVITDGLFTRRLLNDPELSGVSAVLFDEFHERGLNLDLGLALGREVQEGLREDLRLVIMSATLDTARIAGALDAPIIESQGKMFPVETIYLGREQGDIAPQMERAIRRALREQSGSLLCFLPGQGEIRRVAERLGDLGPDIIVAPLYGALSPREQDLAVSPAARGVRKIVLSTDIAESSLTIEGVTVVVDAGLARVPEFDPASSSQTLVTRRASLANVDQRRGRAGRTAPGVCYRLWDEPANRGLPPSPTPEILVSDLAGLVLSLAEWGVADPQSLSWIDTPPEGRVKAAKDELSALRALDEEGRLTPRGRQMAARPLAPALSALIDAQETDEHRALAAEMAALLSEQGLGGRSSDLRERLSRFRQDGSLRAKALRRQAERWASGSPALLSEAGTVLASVLPGRIAKRRGATPGDFLMANGRAARLDPHDPLANEDWLAVAEIAGAAGRSRILSAIPLTEEEAFNCGSPVTVEEAAFDPATGTLKAERVKRLGAIILHRTPLPSPRGELAVRALLDAVRAHGFSLLPQHNVIRETLMRLDIAAGAEGKERPLSEETLLERIEDWLPPLLGGKAKLDGFSPGELRQGLKALLDWETAQALDQFAPLSFRSPAGRDLPIDYLAEGGPQIEARVQEFYGLTNHPSIARGQVPLTVSLTSPAGRPVAVTKDLPGFWIGGYRDMAKDMRGRYPKHDWPDDPSTAKPHEGRTKARLSK
ncbi:ATP-dependent helicase HrpB [Parvularcula marina]|uniref:ATP-dependent helicase HrpB n=1 Tax=Parvularcula marina TaxID=2292771 RepID=UPI0035161822